MARDDLSDDRDQPDQRNMDTRDLQSLCDQSRCRGLSCDDLDKEQCSSGTDHIDRSTGKDDICPQIKGKESHDQRLDQANAHGSKQADQPAPCPVRAQ